MSSYVDLIPPAQSGCAGPYCITTLDPVYGTTQIISAYWADRTSYVNNTITYPTPYGVGVGLSATQIATCADGQTVTSDAYFAPMEPIPLPQTLDYTHWNVEIFSSIPGFNDAFGSLYPNLSHCSFSGFDGQPVPKVVVTQLTTEVTNAVTTTHDSSPTKTAPPSIPTTKDAVTTATPEQTAPTTTLQSTDSPIAPPPQSDQPEQTTAANPPPSNGVGSLILCGLGGPCPSPTGPATDNPPAQPSPTIIYAGDSSIPFYIAPSSAAAAPPPTNAIPLSTAPNGAIAIGTAATLTPGGPATTISGVAISAAPTALHLGSAALPYDNNPPANPPVAPLTLGAATYTYTSGAGLALPATTLRPGDAAAVVSGATLRVGPDGVLSVDGAGVAFATADAAVRTLSVGGAAVVYTAGAGAVVVGTATLRAGGAAATVGGHVVSVGAGGAVVVDGTVVAAGVGGAAVFTAGGVAYTVAAGAGEVVVGSWTLTMGGAAVTVAGDVVSLGESGVVVDGRTVAFGAGVAGVAVVTVGGSVYTLTEGQTTLALGSTTLTVGGPAATVSGEVLSLGPSGVVVDGQSTVPFSNTAVFTTTGTGSGTGVPAQYTGSAARKWPCDRRLLWVVAIVLLAL
ncbi:uncharacterized protein LTHEOB_11005 [Neofusicoccum parvum]|uniref:Uncharacterized protein LTHEOB_11005 n=1 Tax=Neofusicoccum parvum TaxID=310453 RepID=A0ACB5SIG2_9PEZI|nr:uncharacterized protein LTHEOB_11005 [Neofusicoccum parvum]